VHPPMKEARWARFCLFSDLSSAINRYFCIYYPTFKAAIQHSLRRSRDGDAHTPGARRRS
jgi:hypothetical protein